MMRKRLGEILLEDGILSSENLQEALNHQKKEGGLIGQILIRLGYISEENLAAAISKQIQIPYIPLSNYSINMDAAQKLSLDHCKRSQVVVFDQDEKHLWIATTDPLNEISLEELKKKFNLSLQVFISTQTEIMNMIDIIFSSVKQDIKQTG